MLLSSGLVETLEVDEFAAVLAHERAHARLRHDRYLVLAEVASALVPIVRPLHRGLVFGLERWADEDAVRTVGDRRVVSRALARVAMSGAAVPHGAEAFASLGVAERVRLLLAPPKLRHPLAWSVGAAAGVVLTVVAAAWQVHRVALILLALCTG